MLSMPRSALYAFRKNIQIVFQDPYSSLNPRLMIGPAIAEPLKVHESLNRTERKNRVFDLLQKVDLKPEHFNRYPHAFSGGQRQRIVIARALALNPGFVVFDESVSALDVSVQAQVLNLINDLKEKLGFTAIFISHDLSVIRWLCDRVMVMEKGLIIESGEVEVQSRVRTNAGARSAIIERLARRVSEEGKKAQVMVAAANDPALVDELTARVRAYANRVTRLEVGPVIAAHTGAGTGGIGYHFD